MVSEGILQYNDGIRHSKICVRTLLICIHTSACEANVLCLLARDTRQPEDIAKQPEERKGTPTLESSCKQGRYPYICPGHVHVELRKVT